MGDQNFNEDYIKNAFERGMGKCLEVSGKLISEAYTGEKQQYRANINMSSIYTELIQNTGRFCEQYASDLLIDIDRVKAILATPVDTDTEDYIVFALRQSGVDSNSYVSANLENYGRKDSGWIGLYYRRIYALKIRRESDGYIVCELRDVSSDIGYEYKKMVEFCH